MEFTDRILKCSDCGNDFIFTAGEQLFFFDKQFKNDPKRCKLCKAKRAGLGRSATGTGVAALPLSRTETRTQCSSCGIETTVPFKPTQGRPVLCRSCFQLKRTAPVTAARPEPSAIDALPQASTPAIAESSATMEMIAETPASVVAEATESMPALMAAAAEAPQA